jgi:hypothetical protein
MVGQDANTGDVEIDNKREQDRKWGLAVGAASQAGYITPEQERALMTLYSVNPDAANAKLSTWAGNAVDKAGTDTSWQYKEPQAMTDAKAAIAKDLALNPTFNTQMVKDWLPTLLEASSGAKTADNQNNADLMNSMGRLFSGQTLQNSQTINNKYTMDALNKALGYAESDYADQLARKNAATDKSMAVGQYETGIDQYKNNQDVAKALQDFMQNWNTINTNKSQNYNDMTSAINRIYANEDWTKNADLATQIAQITKPDKQQDWEKWINPIATVATSFKK